MLDKLRSAKGLLGKENDTEHEPCLRAGSISSVHRQKKVILERNHFDLPCRAFSYIENTGSKVICHKN